jgi:hypothetical protein
MEDLMTDEEKIKAFSDALEKGMEQVLQGMDSMMESMDELAIQLQIMTEHYVDLAGCGDCGHWDPEKEEKVITARAALSEYAEGKAEWQEYRLTIPQPKQTIPHT